MYTNPSPLALILLDRNTLCKDFLHRICGRLIIIRFLGAGEAFCDKAAQLVCIELSSKHSLCQTGGALVTV